MTTKSKKTKQVPPSRVRYEEANPTVSVRISREFHEELEDLKEMSGLSMADILKAGLDKLELNVEEIYERGYIDGYQVAEQEFKVLVQCSGCGKAHLPVTGDTMKEGVARAFTGWYNKSCR